MNTWAVSGSLLRLIVVLGALGSIPIWKRWIEGRVRTYLGFIGGLVLLFGGESFGLVDAIADSGAGGTIQGITVYLQASGYMAVCFGFLFWLQDIKHSRDVAANRLARERQRLNEVRLNEAKLRAILNCAGEYCIIVCDTDGLVTSYSSGGTHILGYTREDVVGHMHVHDFNPPAKGVTLEQARAGIAEKGYYEAETVLKHKNGAELSVLMTISELKDEAGRSVGLVGIAKDITEIKETRETLRRERDFVRGIIETSEICIVGLSVEDGRITLFNRGAERISGYDRDEAIGRPFADLLLSGERADDLEKMMSDMPCATGEVRHVECPVRTKTGRERLMAWTNSVCCDAEERPTHVIAFGYDLTEQRQMQEKLETAKNELQKANAELKRVAATDFLTGLVNRRQSMFQFEREMNRAQRNMTPVGVVMIDLDRFKPVNDQHGHHAGDAVLAHVAMLLKSRARSSDIVARYGGEEFLVVLPEADLDDTVKVANALRRLVRDNPTRTDDGLELPIRASFGVSVVQPGQTVAVKDVIGQADEALYAAKGLGGNRVVTWGQLHGGKVEPPIAESDAVTKLHKQVLDLTKQNQEAFVESLRNLVERTEAESEFTKGHSVRVAEYAVAVARRMDLEPRDVRNIERAGLLHDLGKAGIPANILHKAGTLTLDDWALVMQHPAVSCRIVAGLGFLKPAVPMIRHHHERPDGRGYPDGLAGEGIPLGARILAVADALDAMTSLRPYRDALSLQKALQELRDGVGKVFDASAVEALLACHEAGSDWPLSARDGVAAPAVAVGAETG